jgi:hypothetical protein
MATRDVTGTAPATTLDVRSALATPEDGVVEAVRKQPLHREILFRTLRFCERPRALQEVESEIASYPEFADCAQDQYHLIGRLVAAGGLEQRDLDVDGGIVTEDSKAGLTEDEIDDLVVSFALVTTAAGVAAAEQLDPRRRIGELLGGEPELVPAYVQVLELCREPRAYSEIEESLGASGIAEGALGFDGEEIHPSYYVSALERVGALVWKDAWTVSDAGRALLTSIAERSLSQQATDRVDVEEGSDGARSAR